MANAHARLTIRASSTGVQMQTGPRWAVACIALAMIASSDQLNAQVSWQSETVASVGTAVVTRMSGGPVKIARGLGAVSNRSSLELEWIMVTDSTLGIVFDGPVGAKGIFDAPWYRYAADMKMRALAPVAAFEVRILTFDIWGQHTETLSFTQLEDMTAGQSKSFDRVWGIYGESRLRSHLTSIAYIASVRLADGRTIKADPSPVLRAAQAIQGSITLQDLEPKAEPVPSIGSLKT